MQYTTPAATAEAMLTAFPSSALTVPTVDFTNAVFQVSDIISPPAPVIPEVTLEKLTTGVNGTGAFDKIMASIQSQLWKEYEDGRITGAEFSKAYTDLTAAALSAGLQFVMSANQSYYQTVAARAQAQVALAETVTARIAAETAKVGLLSALRQADILRGQYALTAMQIAGAHRDNEMKDKQFLGLEKDNTIKDYNITNLLPIQKDTLTETLTGLEKDNAIKDYNIVNLLPIQKDTLTETLTGLENDNAIKTFNISTLLPIQRDTMKETLEAARAQTLDTRVDGSPVAGAIGKQKELQSEQISSFQKDAKLKVAKVFADAWAVQRTTNEDLAAPAQFVNAEIDEVLVALRASVSMGS